MIFEMKNVVSIGILCLIACTEVSKSSECFILVNIGEDDWGEVAKQIDLICNQNPAVLAIDIAFGDGDGTNDSALTNALWGCSRLVIPTEIYSLGDSLISVALKSAGRFCPSHARTGFISARVQDGITRFQISETPSFSKTIEYHFAVQAALFYDSLAVGRLISKSPAIVNVNYEVPRRRFRVGYR